MSGGRPKQEFGVGNTGMTPAMYGFVIRMLADGFKNAKVRAAVARAWPDEAVPSNERLRNLRMKRKPEIAALRKKLNESLDDHWLANKRQRLDALGLIFEDANRWTPKRAIEMTLTPLQRKLLNMAPNDPSLTPEERQIQKELLSTPRSVLVYEKDTGTMLQVLKDARAELGDDSTSRAAQSLEDLVRIAEEGRGLRQTVEAEVEVEGAVPTLLEAEVAETPTFYPSAGTDQKLGLLDGSEEPGSALLELARGGQQPTEE